VPFDPLISGEQARLAPEVRRLLRRLRDARLAEPRLAVLWKYRATRQEELEAQLERVRDLERTREAR
jgi:hypothetical protein